MTSAISNLEPATPTSPKDAKSGDAKSRTDESGVAGGITVLILAVPLLLISALAFYSGRLAQADNHLSWAALVATAEVLLPTLTPQAAIAIPLIRADPALSEKQPFQ